MDKEFWDEREKVRFGCVVFSNNFLTSTVYIEEEEEENRGR